MNSPHRPDPHDFGMDLDGEQMVDGVNYGWLMRDHIARYEYVSRFCRGKRVLDVATGSGYGADILRKRGAAAVVCVDRNETALDYAADRYGTDGLTWMVGDAYALPFEKEFDVVVSFETIEHLTEPEQFLMQCKKAMKDNGVLAMSTPENVGGPYVSRYHEIEFRREEFRALLERHFDSVELLGQRREMLLPIRLLGDLPTKYENRLYASARGSHRMFTFLDRCNKAPNLLAARLLGHPEHERARILPIDEPIEYSRFLKDHYCAMVGICRIPSSAA